MRKLFRAFSKIRLAVLFALAAITLAAQSPLHFESSHAFPELGVSLPLPARALPVPRQLPVKLLSRQTEDAYLLRADVYLNRDLWLEAQELASWQTQSGARISLYHLLYSPPSELARVYREAYAGREPDFDPDDPDALLDWLSMLLWEEQNATVRLSQNAFSLAQVDLAASPDGMTYVFLCRAYTNRFVQDPWFAVEVIFPEAQTFNEVREWFLNGFFPLVNRIPEGDCATLPEAPSLSDKPSEDAEKVDLFLLEAARRQVRHASGWWLDVMGSYIVQSDTHPDIGTALAEAFRAHQIPLHDAFMKLVPPFERKMPTAFVRIVGALPLYRYYAGKGNENSGGVYIPGRKELVLRMTSSLPALESVLRHESFHQYLDAAWGGHSVSAWFNEGHAVFFEQTEYDARTGKLTFTEHPLYATLISENLEAVLENLPRFLRYTYAEFYARDGVPGEGSLNYATAWAFVYFLHKSAPHDIRQPFAHIPKRYAEAIRSGCTPDEATDHAFQGINDRQLRSRFKTFWQSGRNQARLYDPLNTK